MELLKPSSPPRPAAARLAGPPSSMAIRSALGQAAAPRSPGSRDSPEEGVYVAVGNSPEKTASLLRWTFQHFGCKEVGILHVHQPSSTIPTLLGRLPVSQANDQLVSSYRKIERENTKRTLLSFLTICYRAQVLLHSEDSFGFIEEGIKGFHEVQGKIIMTEARYIPDGIIDLVTKHKIQKLVLGETPDNCFMMKGRSSMATYVAKKAPSFCEIWFVNKGKVVWNREPTGSANSQLSDFLPAKTFTGETFRPRETIHDECRFSYLTSSDLVGSRNKIPDGSHNSELAFSNVSSNLDSPNHIDSQNSTLMSSASSVLNSPVHRWSSSLFSSQELEMKIHCSRIKELKMEFQRLRKEASNDTAKCKELELETVKAFNSAKVATAAYQCETKSRKMLGNLLSATKMHQEELVDQRNESMKNLESTMKNVTCLEQYAIELDHERDKAAEELKLIEASIMALKLEKQKIQAQQEEAIKMLGRLRSSPARFRRCKRIVGFGVENLDVTEFSLSDLQTATCEFSESFKLGQGGCGSVYKGEISGRTVVIKRLLYHHNFYGHSEFEQEVSVLGKLRHPHLVTLIGVCREALSLVFEYLPNGTLHDHLFCQTAVHPLTWRARTRIVTEIASALLFLHSSKPEKIIHGDVKPKNIFLDSDFKCKLGDFGICHFVPEDTTSYHLFCRSTEPQGLFPYADPEYRKTGELTTKSDIYSLGIVVLQVLTGKSSLCLPSEVRRAMSAGQLSSILDPTAGEWPISVVTRLAEFGLQCTEINSRGRPELTPMVVKELEELHSMKERQVPQFFLCPILQEIMHDPQVAADGFTYEGSAMREWLQNGKDTSPMTNLKLKHLDLTPSHALRFAIQDWLCQSRRQIQC